MEVVDMETATSQLIMAVACWGKFLTKYKEEKDEYSLMTKYAVISINEDFKALMKTMAEQDENRSKFVAANETGKNDI